MGALDLGDLRRVTPISKKFGLDRGLPIDRYYIERFLQEHRRDIQGRVLEIGDPRYTLKFGGQRVTALEVLDLSLWKPGVTIVGDLTKADHIPSDTFDCIIMTQTLQLIYDVRAALHTSYRILKPGGVLLATFPGISRVAHAFRYLETWEDYWRLTSKASQRLFIELFPPENVTVAALGNVLAAAAFLHGLASEELQPAELEHQDPDYEVLVTVRTVKPG
jgi:SAM-dependent methyltransferase